jgi:hypothetical protein
MIMSASPASGAGDGFRIMERFILPAGFMDWAGKELGCMDGEWPGVGRSILSPAGEERKGSGRMGVSARV